MTLIGRTGTTRSGLPVSLNRAPAPDLAPYIARYFITIIDQPDDHAIEDILLNETALVRVLVRGHWSARLFGKWVPHEGALMFGPQRRAMRVRAEGPMAVAGFAIRPAGWFGLSAESADATADRLVTIDGDWGATLRDAVASIDDHEATFAALEAAARAQVGRLHAPADPVMETFEALARTNPDATVEALCDRLGLTRRRFDRRVLRHFGHMPKVILRRSRFLDIAAVMRGLSLPDEEDLASMRYYDASHLNREFRLFVDMTPAKFRKAATPLLTAGLEVRQQRKLHDRAEQMAGNRAPWLMAPGAMHEPPG